MKSITVIVAFLIIAATGRSNVPRPEPFDQAFRRFKDSYPDQCADVVKEIQKRLPELRSAEVKEAFEVLAAPPGGLTSFVSYVERSSKDKMERATNLLLLATHITGFRKALDQFLVEAAAAQLPLFDEPLLEKVRAIWREEHYFSERFKDEAMLIFRS